jgi:NitT/TauT family transport system ATP-binding protein
MDEPLVSLEEATAERLREVMLALLSRHPTAVLFVTHDVLEAVRLGARVIALPPRRAASWPILRLALGAPCGTSGGSHGLREQVLAAQQQ